MEINKIDSFSRMTNEMRKVIELENEQTQIVLKESADPLDEKQIYLELRKYWNDIPAEVCKIIDYNIDGPYGKIQFRIYYPEHGFNYTLNKGIIYIHGGGFTMGSVDTHDGIMRKLAIDTKSAIIGINYRLAPEYKFPVALDECVALIEHIHNTGNKYFIDKDNISLAGDSAGAYLSLASLLYLRNKRDSVNFIKSLLLFYGTYGLKDSMSRRLYGGYWDGLTIKDLNHYNKSFFSDDMSRKYENLFDCNLTTGIPPTYIVACGLDPLLDDSKLLYKILLEHGTTTEIEIYKGIIHGFLHYSKLLPQSEDAIKKSAVFYNKHT